VGQQHVTIRISSTILKVIGGVLAVSVISFLTALAVTEWRRSDYIDCITQVQADYLDQLQAHRRTRPELSGSSEGAYQQYQRQFDTYLETGDAINDEWIAEMRACA